MWDSLDETVGAPLVGAQRGNDRANGNNRATTRVAPTLREQRGMAVELPRALLAGLRPA